MKNIPHLVQDWRFPLAALLLAVFLTPGVTTAGGVAGEDAKTVEVTTDKMAFSPDPVTVTAGTTIVWKNTSGGATYHNVTSDKDLFASGDFFPDEQWSHTFDTPGEYPYRCTKHRKMTGLVIVK